MIEAPKTLAEARLAAAIELGQVARELLGEAVQLATDDHHTVLLVIGARAGRSYDASVTLAMHGRGVQAAMLNRSLLEDVLDVAWVNANPQIAPEYADDHDRAISLADRDIEWQFKHVGTPLTEDEHAELQAAARRYRGFQASWTLSSEADRIALLKASMPDEAAHEIDYTYQAIKRRSNALLHGSPAAWRQLVESGSRGHRIRADAADHWSLEALRHAVLGFHLVARSIVSSFGLDGTAEHEAFYRASCVTALIAAERLAGLDQRSACPCGSERAVGACHGLPD